MGFCIWFTISTVVRKGICVFWTCLHTCSVKKSKFLWVFACGLLYLQWLENRSKFVYFQHVCSYLQWSEFLKSFFACGLPYLQWLQKGLNLCILDMFDHTCSGLKKSKFLCTNVPRICSFLLCSFFTCGLPYLQWLEKV